MALSIPRLLWLLLVLASTYAHAQLVADSRSQTISELESVLFDKNPAGLFAGVTPCTIYFDSSTGGKPDASLGRQTAAQWIRTAFHDFVTADVAGGTGGLDASVGFETERPENVGVAINDTLFFFTFLVNDRTSMADVIALGTIIAVGACGGPVIPMRGGRIDATGPGRTGVCEPETDIKTTLQEFAGAGFSQQDAIALTACGHSMGGVHHSTFPQIVPASAVSDDNLDGREAFDESLAVFDDQVVQDYLSGTGSRGGPLVTTSNKTVQSDLRLYLSDHNQTMKSLGRSKDHFASTCTNLMARMLDTVPKGVSLTPRIRPSDVKPTKLLLSVAANGTVTLSGTVRYMDAAASAPAPQTLDISLKARTPRASLPKITASTNLTADTGTGIYGPTHSYPFTASFPGTTGVSALAVRGRNFPLQDAIFVDAARSSVQPGLEVFLAPGADLFKVIPYTISITVAVLQPSPSSLTATFAIPRPQQGNMTPRIDRSTALQLAANGQQAGPYTLFSGTLHVDISPVSLFGMSVDVAGAGKGRDVTFFKVFSVVK